MGGFLGIGGASWKTDRSNELSGFQNLRSVFNVGLPLAQGLTKAGGSATAAGTSALGSSLNYWQSLLSGNRANLTQAVAPEATSVRSASDASARQLAASGTARGGGVAATNVQRESDTQSKIDNLIFGVRPQAAGETAKVGSELARVGLGETGEGLSALGIGERSAADLSYLSGHARERDYKINQDQVAKASQAIENVASAFFT